MTDCPETNFFNLSPGKLLGLTAVPMGSVALPLAVDLGRMILILYTVASICCQYPGTSHK